MNVEVHTAPSTLGSIAVGNTAPSLLEPPKCTAHKGVDAEEGALKTCLQSFSLGEFASVKTDPPITQNFLSAGNTRSRALAVAPFNLHNAIS